MPYIREQDVQTRLKEKYTLLIIQNLLSRKSLNWLNLIWLHKALFKSFTDEEERILTRRWFQHLQVVTENETTLFLSIVSSRQNVKIDASFYAGCCLVLIVHLCNQVSHVTLVGEKSHV